MVAGDTIDGRRTLGEIETAIRNLQQQERSLQGELESANAERARLMEGRTAAFRELATVRTRHALSDGVIDQADRLGVRVEALLQARQRTVASLKERLAAAAARREALLGDRAETAAALAELEARLDKAGEAARAELAGDAGFQERQRRRDAVKAIHGKAEEKAQRAEADRVRKGAAYESDPLFMYLWNRRYRGAGYAPHALIRWADDTVAALVGYNEARANYSVLREIPERLREYTARLAAELAEAQGAVDAELSARIRTVAGTDLVAAIEDARARQRKDHAALEAAEAEIGEIGGQLNRYAEGLDDAFRQAVELSAEFLAQESYQRLVALARDTVEPTDDEIVGRIASLERRLEALKQDNEVKRRDLDKLAQRRQELMQIAADFRRAHYDEPGSVFTTEAVIGAVLQELLRGTLSRDGYWDRLKRSQRWSGRPADPFRRHQGFPPFGGGWMGGSWSGGGSSGRSSGGGGSGDDFRTGGSF